MMRILVLSIVDPSIEKGGAWTMTRAVIGLLKEGPLAVEVEVLACSDFSGFARRKRQLLAVVQSFLGPLPAKIEFARSKWMAAKVRLLLAAGHFDLVLLNGTDLLWLLPHLPHDIPRALIAHNIENELFLSQVESGIFSLPVIRSIVNKEWSRLRSYEIEGLRKVGRVVFFSTADESYACAQCPQLATLAIPPIFSYTPTRRPRPTGPADRTESTGLELGLLGNFRWWPNARGLAWFLHDVFPHTSPRLKLHLFGSGSESAAAAHPRIVPHGFVEDLSEVWTTCDFMISPRVAGAGVSVKFAEALYNGMPVLATTKAARGLPLEPQPGIVLLDTAAEWIEFLHRDAASLARRCIPASVATRFYAGSYAKALADFLSS